MTRSKVKLEPIRDENTRAKCFKRRRTGLVKKVKELTTLCDIEACMIIYSPYEVAPMVWPSLEVTHNLLGDFYALPEIEKRKKETSQESYLTEKTRKLHEQTMKMQKKSMEIEADQLMAQLHRDRKITDLSLTEIHVLQTFSQEKIKNLRKRLGFMPHPLRSEPLYEAQSEEIRTTTNDGQNEEIVGRGNEAVERIYIGNLRKNQSRYLVDKWVFASPETSDPNIYQQIRMELASYNINPRRYVPYQGSSSNGAPNLEMELIGSPMMSFSDLVALVSQPLQYRNDNTVMVMNQLSRVNEEGRNNNNGGSMFHISINHGLHQEPPPNQNGTITVEGNVDAAMLSDITMVWPDNFHF